MHIMPSTPAPRFQLRRWLALAGTIALFIVAILQTAHEAPALTKLVPTAILNQQPGLYPVTHISDGDTIQVRTPSSKEETVRLLGVDTPEVKDPRKPVQCFGQAASNYTKQHLAGASVRLEPDPTNTDRDKYGRWLRYVYLPDGTLFNAQLIRQGYAFAYVVFPFTHLDEFRQLEAEARTANRGLWDGCAIDESDKVKQTR
jgi:micrococcal nuclease